MVAMRCREIQTFSMKQNYSSHNTIAAAFLHCTMITCVDSSSEDPRSSCHGCFDEPFPEDLLEFGLEFKVLQPSVHGDEKLGKLQLPFLGHQV